MEKHQDLTGMVFGRLIEEAFEREKYAQVNLGK